MDFNLLLAHDYVYCMGALLSSLFYVMCFLHEGRIVTFEQLSFIASNLSHNQTKSVNGAYMKLVSPLPYINYVVTCSMHTSTDDLVGDVMHHLLWALVLDLFVGSFDMYPFQNIVLPSNECLLEAMVSRESWLI